MSSSASTKRTRPRDAVSSAARVADLGSRGRDTGSLEEALGRLCSLAADLLEVPAVLVALKDEDRPFLGGSFGLEGTEPERWWGATPLSLASSDLANPEGAPLMVEDLAARELLAADPLLQEHGFRALLAVPLRPGAGNFGTVCALSRLPRAWSERDTARLRAIAESVLTEIQLRGSARQVRKVEETSTRATRRSFVGLLDSIDAVVHERDLTAERFTFVGRRAEELFGHPLDRWLDEPDFWREVIVHPSDRERAEGALARAMSGESRGPFEYQALTADGRTLWIRDSVVRVAPEGGPPLARGVMIDVTAWKEAELALARKRRERRRSDEERARREKLLAETQRLARIGSWEWEVATDTITWSEELHRIFGTDPDTFDPSFEAYLARLPDADRELAQRVIGEALAQGGDFEFAHRVLRPDGEVREVQSQGQTVLGPDGTPERMFGIAQDMTHAIRARERERELEREQIARAEAEAAQQRIRGVVESITDAFVAVDHQLCITYMNPAGERVLGGSAAELTGRPLLGTLPAGAEGIASACARSLASGEPVEMEAHLDRSDSWVDVRVFPSGDGLSLYLYDATDRRRAEELMRSSESRYRFLADSVPQQIWTADPTGRLDYVNQVVLDYTGRSFHRMLDEGWEAVIHPDSITDAMKRWRHAIDNGAPLELEVRLRRADGEYRWHLCRARCQTSPDGAVLRWYGANTDIHDQKELEAARDQALDDLERVTHLLSSERTNLEMQARELRRFARALKKSNEDLDRFAYVASHDLKAPLRGIANLTSWLVEDIGDKLTDETREYATLLQNRVQRMEALIDGILQYSRAGRSRDEPETIDVGALVRDVIELLDPPEHFEFKLGSYWPVIRTERTPLQQVFLNLIGNAIKHANGEQPVIEVRLRDEGEDFCEFCVIDNGPGIAPEYHERIFTIFQTLRARDEVEGTGIGLSVVKRTVENQGGQVWVESEVGRGASFSFLWPRDPDAKERTLG